MSVFLSLFKKEFRTSFLSPIAYVVMFFFWVLSGGNFIWLLQQMTSGKSLMFATQGIFGGMVLTFAVPFVVPLITMRLFAEERKLGTLEALLTTSVRVPELVLAKFAGALVFYAVLWLPVLVYLFTLVRLCPQEVVGFPDGGAIWSAFVGVFLIGALYIAVGLCMSAMTSNQIVAAIASFALLFGSTLVLTFMASSSQSSSVQVLGQYYSSYVHMLDFSRGILDSRIIVMYLCNSAWFLFVTTRLIEAKRV
ncbi:MAG: ABC transporter permease [Pontiellaceae bacterium]|nr:ABC transporter permease [Pontiellaceae bacterium]MBN2784405.1 ABC transporter permease [Pontiellaceae bacterium]